MLRICKLIAMSILLVIAAFTSGCYTIVGYPPEVEESIVEEEAAGGQAYNYYEYYHDYPYLYDRGYYDPYYGSRYPYYYYGDYPRWWYYDDYYYWDYEGDYVPDKKRETKQRGASELRRAPRPESRRGSRLERDEEKDQSSREIPVKRRAESRPQKSVRKHRDSTSGSEKPSAKRKSQEEEK